MKCIEEEEQQLLGILLGVVVELREDGEEHGPGLLRGTAGAPARPHLLQQTHKNLHHPTLGPVYREIKALGNYDCQHSGTYTGVGASTLPALFWCPDLGGAPRVAQWSTDTAAQHLSSRSCQSCPVRTLPVCLTFAASPQSCSPGGHSPAHDHSHQGVSCKTKNRRGIEMCLHCIIPNLLSFIKRK